jgi:hypothetical protein
MSLTMSSFGAFKRDGIHVVVIAGTAGGAFLCNLRVVSSRQDAAPSLAALHVLERVVQERLFQHGQRGLHILRLERIWHEASN